MILFNSALFSQSSFELTVSDVKNETFTFSFMDLENSFVSIGSAGCNFSSDCSNGFVVKYDNFGNLINQKEIIKYDTAFGFSYGLVKGNGNYLLFGTLSDTITSSDRNVTYICEMTPDLDIVWEKMIEFPEPYINHVLINFLISPDSNIIIQGKADSVLYAYNDLLFTMVLDMEGNQSDISFYTGWKDYGIYSDMIFNQDSTFIYLIGTYVRPNSSLAEWTVMDMDLEIVNYTEVIDWDHAISTPLSAKMNLEGNIVMADRATMEPGAYNDLYVKVMDTNLNTLYDTLLFYPEKTYLATNKGLGFIDPDYIWITTFEGNFTYFMGTEVFRFLIFDSELNLIGMKEYGGDKRYWFFNMLVTPDGGCLLTGMVPDYEGSLNHDAYVIKVMPDDIITHAEETSYEFDRDVFVFPNPFSSQINVQTIRKGLSFNLYDVSGKCFINSEIIPNTNNKLLTGNLKPGFYFYTIQYQNRIIQSGKLIKE